MTFTYDLASVNATLLLISKVRLEIGDNVSGAGVRPDGSNLTDEEITLWLTAESDDVLLASARACSALSRMWAIVAVSETVGPRKTEMGNVSARFLQLSDSLSSQNSRPVVYII